MPKLGMRALFFAIDAEQGSAKFSIQESKYRMRIKMRGSCMSSRAFTLGLDPYIVTMAGRSQRLLSQSSYARRQDIARSGSVQGIRAYAKGKQCTHVF